MIRHLCLTMLLICLSSHAMASANTGHALLEAWQLEDVSLESYLLETQARSMPILADQYSIFEANI